MASRRLRAAVKHPLRAARFAAALLYSPPILCPSTGRAGSTLLHRALIAARARAMLGSYRTSDWGLIADECWDLSRARWRSGSVIKTHDLPDRLAPPASLKVVFVFDRPSEVVLSVLRRAQIRGAAWIAAHFEHFHAPDSFERLAEADALGLGAQIAGWTRYRGTDTFSVRYDALWDAAGALGDFLGFPVALPPRTDRDATPLDPAVAARVREFYAPLDAAAAALPPWQARVR